MAPMAPQYPPVPAASRGLARRCLACTGVEAACWLCCSLHCDASLDLLLRLCVVFRALPVCMHQEALTAAAAATAPAAQVRRQLPAWHWRAGGRRQWHDRSQHAGPRVEPLAAAGCPGPVRRCGGTAAALQLLRGQDSGRWRVDPQLCCPWHSHFRYTASPELALEDAFQVSYTCGTIACCRRGCKDCH